LNQDVPWPIAAGIIDHALDRLPLILSEAKDLRSIP